MTSRSVMLAFVSSLPSTAFILTVIRDMYFFTVSSMLLSVTTAVIARSWQSSQNQWVDSVVRSTSYTLVLIFIHLMQYHSSHLSHIISLSSLLTNVFSQLAHFAVSSLAFDVEKVRCALLLVPWLTGFNCVVITKKELRCTLSLVFPLITSFW